MLDRWIVDNEPSPTYPIYTRANAGEVYPDPVSPLGATLATSAGEDGWRDSCCLYSMREDEFDPRRAEIMGVFGGYLYLNMSLTRIFGVRMPGMTPEQIDLQYFGDMPGIPPYQPRPSDEDPERTAALQAWVGEFLTTSDLPELREERATVDALVADRPDLTTLGERELVERLRSFGPLYRDLFNRHITVSAASGVGVGIVAGVAEALGDPSITMAVMAGIGDVDSAAPSYAMWDLARLVAASPALTDAFDAGIDGLDERVRRLGTGDASAFVAGFDAFLHEYGSRGPNEWELRCPTWGTDPALALAAIDRMRLMGDGDAPRRHQEDRRAESEAVVARTAAILAGDPEAQGQFLAAASAGRLHLAGRERTKTTIIKVVHEMRLAARELGRRALAAGTLADVDHIFMVKADELDEFLAYPSGFTRLVAEREAQYLQLFELEPPFILAGEVPPLDEWARRGSGAVMTSAAGDVLTGIAGCPGQATGRARVILDPSDPGALEPGDVLVAPITDPSWTPLFVPAAAVVVDVGAQVSHAVIVSRELGIPCVVSVIGATAKIPDGAVVSVDGTTGTVTVL